MKKVPTGEVKNRSRQLTSLFESFTPYEKLEGRVERVWVTDTASDGIHLVRLSTRLYLSALHCAQERPILFSLFLRDTDILLIAVICK
jgi:threonylcarbamoyladenosine tRNA methylthiotransferase CDKAL1